MPVFKDEERNTFYVKTYYTDYTGARKQKMKRGFKLQREAKELERRTPSKKGEVRRRRNGRGYNGL